MTEGATDGVTRGGRIAFRVQIVEERMDPRTLRRNFMRGLVTGLRVVWPVLSAVLSLIVALGVAVGALEGWSLQESMYFSFVTGLTIGYGDLAPTGLLSRTLSILIGANGILLTALVAAVAVKALTGAHSERLGPHGNDTA